jgi:hypothetical protein
VRKQKEIMTEVNDILELYKQDLQKAKKTGISAKFQPRINGLPQRRLKKNIGKRPWNIMFEVLSWMNSLATRKDLENVCLYW